MAADPLAVDSQRRARWERRARTIPLMLGATTAGLVGLPLLLTAAVAADLARGRRRLPTARVVLFVLQYGVNDCVEILAAGPLWLVAGAGRRLHRPASIRRHERLQAWSIGLLARRAEQLLNLRLAVEPGGLEALAPGPVIVLGRHVNVVDSSLPSWLYQQLGLRSRGVMMAELLADPGFDLIYARTGSAFIGRDDGPEARSLVARVADGAGADTAVVIFPEGRLFRPERLASALARLGERSPDRAERLAALRHLLPPRPGGVLALLDALPGADVVVIGHAGLDRHPAFADLARAVPLAAPVTVTVRRIPAADIPTDPARRIAWLDGVWLDLDRWVGDALGSRPGGPA